MKMLKVFAVAVVLMLPALAEGKSNQLPSSTISPGKRLVEWDRLQRSDGDNSLAVLKKIGQFKLSQGRNFIDDSHKKSQLQMIKAGDLRIKRLLEVDKKVSRKIQGKATSKTATPMQSTQSFSP